MTKTPMQDLDLICQICSKCGTPQEYILEVLGRKRKVKIPCACESEAYAKKQEEEQNKEKLRMLERLKRYSLMDGAFEQCTFENWQLDERNKVWYKLGKNYCENWQNMKQQNVGMLFYGPPGTGKSYLSFCIANELLRQYVPVIATSSINIINKIYESYRSYGEEGEVAILNQFKQASLVILDDLGAEHEGKTGKEKQIIYSLIDTRMRLQLPTIITTNLTPQQLKNKLTGADGVHRTYDRIVEACPAIEITGESKRIDNAKQKLSIVRNLVR